MKRLLMMAVSCILIFMETWSTSAYPDQPSLPARPLKFETASPNFFISFGGKFELHEFSSSQKASEVLMKENLSGLMKQVDFEKEKLVLVSWLTSGPPEGKLMQELVGSGGEKQLVFFVQGPKGVQIRGQRARLGADFFAVPKNLQVVLNKKERS